MNTSLHLGHLGLIDSAPLLVAAQHGFFRDEGLLVELSCELGLTTLVAKLLDLRLTGACLPAPLPILLSLGLPTGQVQMESALLVSFQDLTIVRRTTPPPEGPKTKALRFGIPAQTTAARLVVQRWFDQNKPTLPPEITFVPLSTTQLPVFLEDQLIDGFCGPEPLITLAMMDPGVSRVATSAELFPMHPGSVVAMRTDAARIAPELIPSLSRALQRACAYCNSPANRAEVWTLVTAQPPFARLPVAQREEWLNRSTALSPKTATCFVNPLTGSGLTPPELAFVADCCRASHRSSLRGYDLAGTIERVFRAQGVNA